jgi:hypothetical protein
MHNMPNQDHAAQPDKIRLRECVAKVSQSQKIVNSTNI